MNIAIVTPSPIPFVIGGAEKLFWGLLNAINQLTPHNADLIKIPCNGNHFWGIIEGAYRFSQLNLEHFDLVITTKDPAWLISHPNHMVYMQHKCRGVYDLYHKTGQPVDFTPNHRQLEKIDRLLRTPPGRHLLQGFFQELFRLRDIENELPPFAFAFPGPLTRAIIHWLDKAALSIDQIRHWRAISRNVVNRQDYFPVHANGSPVDVRVIHHPTDLSGLHTGDYRHIFTASRLEQLKRIDLLVKAYDLVDEAVSSTVEFHIAGTGGQEEALKKLASQQPQIKFPGYLNDAALVDCYASALFVPFIPYDEDYGLITLEAMLSGKAVLTTRDSGGVNELVEHGRTGFCVEPDVKALASAMEDLIKNRTKTILMGKNALEAVSHINWPNTVNALLEAVEPCLRLCHDFGKGSLIKSNVHSEKPSSKAVFSPAVVMANTFSVFPPFGGGQKRIFHLFRELASVADISLVNIGGYDGADGVSEAVSASISSGLEELVVPRNQSFHEHTCRVSELLKVSADDIASIKGYEFLPAYGNAFMSRLDSARLVILSHPYLFHAVRKCWNGSIWYDAHNVEYDIKSAIVADTSEAKQYLDQVFEVEKLACLEADLIMPCSRKDAQRLCDLYGVSQDKMLVIPNGVDANAVAPLPKAEKTALKARIGLPDLPVALFMGSLHKPNIDSLSVICRLAEHCPDVIFLVMGSVCKAVSVTPSANLLFLGMLDEKEKNVVLQLSDIGLNPVVSGSGTNLKLVEYAAAGLVCLTTPHGLRGLDFRDGEHLKVAEIEVFSEELARLAKVVDSYECNQMISRAVNLARSAYDWAVVAKEYRQRLMNFLNFQT